jgi:hypothetical protein
MQIVKTDFSNRILAVFNIYIMNTQPTKSILAAIKCGDLPLLISLHQQGWGWSDDYHSKYAKGGHHCARYLFETCPYEEYAVTISAEAAKGGHLDCLRYLYGTYCSWDEWATRYAAKNGHLDCLQYLHEHGCPWDEYAISEAAKGGHLECLRYLHEHGCPWDEDAISEAAKGGHLECLRYLHQKDCELKEEVIADAAEGSHLDSLRYLYERHENNYRDKPNAIYFAASLAAENGHLDCLQYLHEHGCLFLRMLHPLPASLQKMVI